MPVSTIQNASLASGVPGKANLPTGSVIQVISNTFTDTTTNTTQYSYASITNGSITITSTLANSTFLVQCACNGYFNGSGAVNIGLQRTISGNTTRLLGVDGSGGDSWMGAGNGPTAASWSISKIYLDSPSQVAGTSITYQLLLGCWATGQTWVNYAGYQPKSNITIMEIAG